MFQRDGEGQYAQMQRAMARLLKCLSLPPDRLERASRVSIRRG
jgi:hypothetical protein